jgi:hypothetical protein
MSGETTCDMIFNKIFCCGIVVMILLASFQDYSNIIITQTNHQRSLLQSTIPPFSYGAWVSILNPETCDIVESNLCSGLWSCLDLMCTFGEKGSHVFVNPNMLYSYGKVSEENLIKRLNEIHKLNYENIKKLEEHAIFMLYVNIICSFVLLFSLFGTIEYEVSISTISNNHHKIRYMAIMFFMTSLGLAKFMHFDYMIKSNEFSKQLMIHDDSNEFLNSLNNPRFSIEIFVIQSIFLFISGCVLLIRLRICKWINDESILKKEFIELRQAKLQSLSATVGANI